VERSSNGSGARRQTAGGGFGLTKGTSSPSAPTFDRAISNVECGVGCDALVPAAFVTVAWLLPDGCLTN
jgi:hypothetical protein